MAEFELKLLDDAQDGLPAASEATSVRCLPPALRRACRPMAAQNVSRIVCLSTGNEDDLEPLVALALALLDLGYPAASVLAYRDMASYVEGASGGRVGFKGLEQQRHVSHAELAHVDLAVLEQEVVHGMLNELSGECALLFTPLDARTASSLAQKLQIPALMIASTPLALPAAPHSPRSAIVEPLQSLYTAVTTLLSTSPELKRDAEVRKSLGLPPSRGHKDTLVEFIPENLPYIAAFAPVATGCSTAAGTQARATTGHVVGHLSLPPLLAAAAGGVAPRLVASFLASGAPPIAVLFSTPEDAPTLDRATALGAVREAVEQGGLRAVVVWAGAPPHVSGLINPSLLVVPSAPLGWLLPQCAAVIHPGDSASSVAAVRCGTPALILPAAAAAGKYWAKHLGALGVAVDGSAGGKGGGEGRWGSAAILGGLPGALAERKRQLARDLAEAAAGQGGASYAAEVARVMLDAQAHCGDRFEWCGWYPRLLQTVGEITSERKALDMAHDKAQEAECRSCERRSGDMPSGSSALMLDSDFCRACGGWTCGPCVRWLPLVPGQSLLPPRVPVCVLCFAKREIKEAEEVWEGEAGRCERCKTYFPSKAAMLAAKCSAHPGQMLHLYFRWSCCNGDSEAAPPCRTFQQHRQCRTTLEAMEKMGISGEVREGGMDEQLKHKIAAIEEEEEKIIEAEREREAQRASIKAGKETEAFFEHLYVSGETLPGLALRYGVTVQDIKRANGILHSNMDPGVKVLHIPKRLNQAPAARAPPPANKADQLVGTLQAAAKGEGLSLGRQEARFYLSDADDNVGLALDKLKEDVAWEQAHEGGGQAPRHAKASEYDDEKDADCSTSFTLLGGTGGNADREQSLLSRMGNMLGF